MQQRTGTGPPTNRIWARAAGAHAPAAVPAPAPVRTTATGTATAPEPGMRGAVAGRGARGAVRDRTRRAALRTLMVAVPSAAVTAALTPLARIGREPVAASGTGVAQDLAKNPGVNVVFDERYRGRHLQAVSVAGDRPQVTVDGRPLHLMRSADGGWLSMVDHYCVHPTQLDATRAAVDELGAARLV